ncbi:unnamed protein product [Meganyctiphanes norvegica]|uniref:Replication protein A C-terminal domain-containing protein n=1 Tax=Meganyctiphanes norvegica TaxID=48144 RepID=A0AAV2Q218_MEGNR
MWNSTGGGYGEGGFDSSNAGGGFMDTSAQFGTPGQGEKKARRSQNLVPITIKQVLQSPDDTITVAEMEVHMVQIVGVIRSVDVTSTKITYTLSDSTGTIDAVQWLETDSDDDDGSRSALMENTYCRLAGSVRSHQGKRNLMIFKIAPVTDLNLITTHILQVMHSQLKLENISRMQKEGGMGGGPMNTGGGMSHSLVGAGNFDGGSSSAGGGGFSGVTGLTGQQNMVYQVINTSKDEQGASRDSIYGALMGKVGRTQVDEQLEFLSSEGHIYSTVDDDHFRTTDG